MIGYLNLFGISVYLKFLQKVRKVFSSGGFQFGYWFLNMLCVQFVLGIWLSVRFDMPSGFSYIAKFGWHRLVYLLGFPVCFGFLFLGDALLFKFPYLLVLVSLGSDPCSSFSGKEDSSFTNALRFSPLHSGSSLGKYPISFGSFSGLLSTWIIEKYRDSEEY